MIVVPSPELLIHRKSRYYEEHISKQLELSEDENVQTPIIIDEILGNYSKDDCFTRRSRVEKLNKASAYSITPELAILYASISYTAGNDDSAFFWYKIAAKYGNVKALKAIGRLFLKGYAPIFPNPAVKDDMPAMAIRWFQRAIHLGSTDCNQYIANSYVNQNNYPSALHYFFTHFQITSSLYSKIAMTNIFGRYCSDGKVNPLCWYLSTVSDGHLSSIKNLLDRTDCKYRHLWEQLSLKYRSRIFTRSNFHTSFFSKNYVENRKVDDVSRLSDIFWQFDTIQNHSDQNYFISPENNNEYHELNYCLKLTDSEFHEKEFPQMFSDLTSDFFDPSFYPISNKTSCLFHAFKFASSKFEDRNLKLALLMLKKGQITQYELFRCNLYNQKKKSNNSDDIVSCGLLASILGEHEEAKNLFFKAAQRGHIQASLLYGLYLFHSSNKEDFTSGSVFLARCMTDPIALIHLGLANDDIFYLHRAAEILKIQSQHEMFEWVGNCFALGIHLPRNITVALMWYGAALQKKEEAGADTTQLCKKINTLNGVDFTMSLFC